MRVGIRRSAKILLCLLPVLLASTVPAAAKKLALVIGINAYPNLPKGLDLLAAVPDAQAVAKALLAPALGFDDVRLLDGTLEKSTARAGLETAWAQVLAKLQSGDTLVVYFAGHGVEFEGQNFLLASDVTFAPGQPAVTKAAALDLQRMFQDLAAKQQELGDVVGIFFIDACRENPTVQTATAVDQNGVKSVVLKDEAFARGGSTLEKGLAPVVPPGEMFVMYSAGIGQTASDEGQDGHSLFASEFLKLLKAPVALSTMAQTLQSAVYDAAPPKHIQTPAYYNQLRRSRTIAGVPAEPKTIDLAEAKKQKKKVGKFGPRDTLIECTLCPEMVVVDAGNYAMGSPATDQLADANEFPPRPVTLDRFAIGKYEVTHAEWQVCAKDMFNDKPACPAKLQNVKSADPLKPVTSVTWDEAKLYTAWLSRTTGQAYRLPSEAEWEYAARAGSRGYFSFTEDLSAGGITPQSLRRLCKFGNGADRTAGALSDVNLACEDGFGRTLAPRGSFLPNKFGVFDMMGNAWEWVEDCWHPNYEGAPKNGAPWLMDAAGTCDNRVARGGSWRSGPKALRSATRHYFPKDHDRVTLGFRVARTVWAAE